MITQLYSMNASTRDIEKYTKEYFKNKYQEVVFLISRIMFLNLLIKRLKELLK